MDPELAEITSFFDSAEKFEEDQIEVSPSSNWSVSHVDAKKKICSYFNICFVSFYEFLFIRIKFKFPLNVFEKELLKRSNISVSQLHSSAQAFAKEFQYLYEFPEKVLCLDIFFKISSVSHTSKYPLFWKGMLTLFQTKN